MSRHVVDNRTPSDGSRLVPFTRIERRTGDEGSHPAAKALSRRRSEIATDRRLTQFLRIERGDEA